MNTVRQRMNTVVPLTDQELPMKTLHATNIVALLTALALTAAEFLIIEYDAQQRVVEYQAQIQLPAQRG
jgi:hypothetical protein